MWDTIWAVVVILGSIGGIAVLIYLQAKGTDDFDREEEARDFFDLHGHWPDETAEDAEERMRSARASAHAVDEAARAGSRSVDVSDAPADRGR